MIKRHLMCACAVATALVSSPPSDLFAQQAAGPPTGSDSARVILQRYADAWRGRQELPFEGPLIIAFWVGGSQGGEYNLALSQEAGAVVREGVPASYDIGFEFDIAFLRRLDRGEIGALTAMGQARSSDPIPLNPKLGPQFNKRPDASLLFRRLSFHFWNRDWPETVAFGESATRQVHGANAAVFVYDQEFRSAWYQLKPGMHINADPLEQANDFPQLVVVTRGQFKARLDGRERIVSEGQAIFIPAGMTHEFWAEAGQYGEVIWTAFGKGA
jgi:mannose-6-phosphate isomerase-like protein (cupin superfamily)